jgi:type I restriction enzyme M protein
MDMKDDVPSARSWVSSLAEAGLSHPSIREAAAVFHLIAWAEAWRGSDADGSTASGFLAELTARIRSKNQNRLRSDSMQSALVDLAADLQAPRSSVSAPQSFEVCFALLAATVHEVSRIDNGILVRAAAAFESMGGSVLERAELLPCFDQIVRATGEHERWPFAFPQGLEELVVMLSGSDPRERTVDPELISAQFMLTAEQVIAEIRRRNENRSSPNLGAHRFMLGLVRFVLGHAGVSSALSAEPRRTGIATTFDFSLANPPFGAKVAAEAQSELPLGARNVEEIFITRTLEQLRERGRAAIVVPMGFLSRGGQSQELRRWLVQEGHVEAVVRLPSGIFSGAPGLRVGILVLDKGCRAKSIRMVEAAELGHLWKQGNPRVEISRSNDALGTIDIRYGVRPMTMDPAHAVPLESCESWDVPVEALAASNWNFAGMRNGPTALRWLRSRLGETMAARGELITLGSCADLKVGLYVQKKDVVDDPPQDDPLAYFRIGDIQKAVAATTRSWVERSAALRIDPSRFLRGGDVLLSRSGTVGKAGIVHGLQSRAIAGGGLYVVRVDARQLDPAFLVAYFGCAECQAWLTENSRRSVIPNLTLALMKGMNVPRPPLPVQREAAACFRESGTDVLEFLRQKLDLRDLDTRLSNRA